MIRFTEKTNREINRVVRNFNAKIRRLEKISDDLELPDKTSIKELKQIKTRKELNRTLKRLKRYSKRGIEETITTKGGVTTSKYNLLNLKMENKRLKANLTRKIHEMENEHPFIAGVEQVVTFASMGDPKYNELKAKREELSTPIEELSETELSNREKLLTKLSKGQDYVNEQFKESYIEMLNELGYFFEYPSQKLEYIASKIRKVPREKFDKMFNQEQAIKDIIYHYYRMFQGVNIKEWESAKEEVWNLYDILYESIDMIVLRYIPEKDKKDE